MYWTLRKISSLLHSYICERINYSLEFERIRLKTSFEKIAWFREHGYNPLFPGNKGISNIDETQGLNELLDLVEAEYDQQYFADVATKIENQWQWFTDHWNNSSLKNTDLVFENEYEVFLTSYGVRGSYDLPNMIVVNVRQREHEIIIFHEIIHLCIEPMIQRYSIPHWYKERLVDLFYKQIFPEKAFEQNLPKEVLAVDPIFNNHFSHHEKLIHELSKYLEGHEDVNNIPI